MFPFPFRLALTYRVEDGGLHVDYEVSNPGPDVLPASLGAHPAFRWPLGGGDAAGCLIRFAEMRTRRSGGWTTGCCARATCRPRCKAVSWRWTPRCSG